MQLTVGELQLLIEALTARASRLHSYGRANPRTAGPNDRKADAMLVLRDKLRRDQDPMHKRAAQ